MGDWVRYKLDRQVDHVLVDEAQDTNAAQWEIIEQLVEEFFAAQRERGRAPHPVHGRRLQAGDLRLPGHRPARFERGSRDVQAPRELAARLEDTLDLSSARARVPRPVDRRQLPFGPADPRCRRRGDRHARPRGAGAGRAAAGATSRIIAERPGQVELWPPFATEERPTKPTKARSAGSACAIGTMRMRSPSGSGDWSRKRRAASLERPLTPGDILILVRSRGELASLIVARLYAAGVPVAGVDRLHLHEPLAVQDLLAACRFAVQPNDDLNLACLLVSPLIGWDQEQLRALAYGRKGSAVARASPRADEETFPLCPRGAVGAAADRRLHPAVALPRDHPVGPARRAPQALPPARHGGARCDRRTDEQRARVRAQRNRLARPVSGLVLARHGRGPARSGGSRANEVRVMTVHGAKGLEAPVVILADATADPARLGRAPHAGFRSRGSGRSRRCCGRSKDERCPPFDEVIAPTGEARPRGALAAALCRADPGGGPADRQRGRAQGEEGRVRPATAQQLARGGRAGDGGHERRAGRGRWGSARLGSARLQPRKRAGKAAAPPAAVPDWARRPAPPEARPPRPLAPSAIAVDDEAAPPPSEACALPPGAEPDPRAARAPARGRAGRASGCAALRWLERSAGLADAGRARRDRRPGLRRLSPTRASRRCSGRDRSAKRRSPRLCPMAGSSPAPSTGCWSSDDRISVIDFKTGRVPANAAAIPAAHRAQMRAYGEALRVIFPGREVSADPALHRAGRSLHRTRCLSGGRRSAHMFVTFEFLQEICRHGHQDGHRPEFCN